MAKHDGTLGQKNRCISPILVCNAYVLPHGIRVSEEGIDWLACECLCSRMTHVQGGLRSVGDANDSSFAAGTAAPLCI